MVQRRPAEIADEATFLKPYEIRGEVGKGGFSTVYEAIEKATGQRVALKVITKTSKEIRDDVLKEFEIQRRFESPYIVNIIDFADCGSKLCLVLEFMNEGELFEAIIREGAFSERQAADYTKQICMGIKVLHDSGVVHRDLKPENLLIQSDSRGRKTVKISDFGLATFYQGQPLSEFCGTVHYTSPQVLQNIPYTTATDMWTLGIIVYVMLGAFRPFESDDQSELLRQILEDPLEFPDPEWTGISEGARDFCRRLIRVPEEERMSVDQALAHPWLRTAPTRSIPDIRRHLKIYHVQERVRRILLAAKMANLLAVLAGE